MQQAGFLPCSSNNTLPAATIVTLPTVTDENATLEPLEGMLVKVAGPLTVTNNYDLAYYGLLCTSCFGRADKPFPISIIAQLVAGQEPLDAQSFVLPCTWLLCSLQAEL